MKHLYPVCGAICLDVSLGIALMASVVAHAADVWRYDTVEAKGMPG